MSKAGERILPSVREARGIACGGITEEMQAVLDTYLIGYNTKRPHQGRGMNGRTPAKAFIAGIPKTTNKKEDSLSLQPAA